MNSETNIVVSIIMLTYNHEKYVAEAIESVLAQKTNHRYELLIGDDCSTDNTRDIIQGYSTKYPEKIKSVFNPVNIGCTANLQQMYKKATGKYIAYLEGDDKWISDEKLQKQVDFLEHYTDYSAITGLIDIISEAGSVIGSKLSWVSSKTEFTSKDFDGLVLPGHTSSLVHRNIYADHPELLLCYDWNANIGDRVTILHLLKYGKIHCLQEKLSAYRHIRGAKSTNITSKVYQDKLKGLITDIEINNKMCDFARRNDIRFRMIYSKQLLFVRVVRAYVSTDLAGRTKLKTAMRQFKNKAFYWCTLPIAVLRVIIRKLYTRKDLS